ncbi:MAG: AAC(3) family N-acetyltransferase, partial [Anaerolineales bacterium]|nr:AAC(3) family N-acetyltransferase [Anaerolineales bacterium]
MSEQAIIDNTTRMSSVDTLVVDLRAFGIHPGATLLVHASLSSIGWVCGGAVAVIQALEQVLTPQGT